MTLNQSNEFIPVAQTFMGEEEARAASAVIYSGWITQGKQVAAFEAEFAEFVGAKHAVAVSNCTTALHLALLAVGVGPGDEVITVSHSFIATANSVRYCGAIPVFVDIDPQTLNMDVSQVVAAISPKTKAILCVHQVGMPADLTALVAIAKEHNIRLIEDAACAIGSQILFNGNWEQIGKPHGDIACFSFHPRKLLSTGDGGMLTTNNAEYARHFQMWRQHSMSVPDTVRHQSNQVIFEQYTELGYNYRMTDIQAAIGREQLKRVPQMVERRRELAAYYHEKLSQIFGLTVPYEPEGARSNWQSYLIRLPDGIDQQHVMQKMLDAGIATRRGIMCAHREPAYEIEPWRTIGSQMTSQHPSGVCEELIHSEQAQDQCIVIPLFMQMTQAMQDRIVDTLASICEPTRQAVKG